MIPLSSFSLSRLPRLEFARGAIEKLPEIAERYGHRLLLVTGAASLQQTRHWGRLVSQLKQRGMVWEHVVIGGEPSPDRIDELANQFRADAPDAVVGIGGGSVLDAAKAIAGLLLIPNSVMDFLEGVGPELDYTGPSVPFIAVPTTAGTGSETTKNAVLSVQGEAGFKKSFRHERLIAEYAIVDPALLGGCPPELIAGNGMDALTQLLESYVSIRANTLIDALAISGLRAVRDSLLVWYENGEQAETAQDKMAYAAMLSGITLAQVGLGSVHGLASPLGAFYPIPHGTVCGTLVAAATEVNLAALNERDAEGIGLKKYARAGDVLTERRHASPQASCDALVELLQDWTARMKLPRLGHFGVTESGLDKIVAHSRGSSMKTNPIVLSDQEIKRVLLMRL